MIDIIASFLGFGVVALIILAVIAIVPRWIVLSTESENDPDHIYTIFKEESGYRGQKISSAAGSLFPFILISIPTFEIEGLVVVGFFGIFCFFYHASVYKNYPVLNLRMKQMLLSLLVVLATLSLLTRLDYLSSKLFIFILISSGFLWGAYAVYRRSELIRIERHSSPDKLNAQGGIESK